MLEKFKNKVLGLAKEAVYSVEKELYGESGKNKKIAAIKYVISHLPVASSIKYILGFVLSVFIDSAVEIAVAFMNKQEIIEEI